MSRVVKDFWRVIYTTKTNSSIQSCWIKHLAFDTFRLFASHIGPSTPEIAADDKFAYVYF